MKYRSRIDIVAKMLEIALGGAVKTRIMYRAFISSLQLKEYLEMLADSDLLEYSEEKKKYYTTERGRHFLKLYNEVVRTMAPVRSKGDNAKYSGIEN